MADAIGAGQAWVGCSVSAVATPESAETRVGRLASDGEVAKSKDGSPLASI